MSSYEGGHMTAVNTVLYKHGRHSRFSLRIGRNLTTKPSTHDDATLRGSPAVWSSGCEASRTRRTVPQAEAYIFVPDRDPARPWPGPGPALAPGPGLGPRP
eukprot:SAG25_NODE_1183_length_3668_cov_124.933875_2_plen_101_part_00